MAGRWGRAGCRWAGSSRKQPSLLLTNASKTNVLKVSPEARTIEALFKAMEERNERLTSSYPLDHGRSSFLAADQCTDAHFFGKPYSCKACPGSRNSWTSEIIKKSTSILRKYT